MVGNDIVDIDLARTQSNWRRPRYLSKLFTAYEQELIHSSNKQTLKVWTLWSMKEAAYKLYTQIHPGRFYSPKSFECSFENGPAVSFKSFCFKLNTITTDSYILSEAYLKNEHVISKVINLQKKPNAIKEQALKLFSAKLNCKVSEVSYTKSGYGVPYVCYNNEKYYLSISHHGKYGAIAIA